MKVVPCACLQWGVGHMGMLQTLISWLRHPHSPIRGARKKTWGCSAVRRVLVDKSLQVQRLLGKLRYLQ